MHNNQNTGTFIAQEPAVVAPEHLMHQQIFKQIAVGLVAVWAAANHSALASLDAAVTVRLVVPSPSGQVATVVSETYASPEGIPRALSVSDVQFGAESNPIRKGDALGSAAAFSDYGILRVSSQSSATGLGGASANGNAGYSDAFRIDGGSLNGTAGTIVTRLQFNWRTDSLSTANNPSFRYTFNLQLNGYAGPTIANETFDYATGLSKEMLVPGPNGTPVNILFSFDIEIVSNFVFGRELAFSSRLSATTGASGALETDLLGDPFYATSFVRANAYESAYWGGIRVFDSSGVEVTDFGFSSTSGTDWRRSFIPEVPEPGTVPLFALGLLGLIWGRKFLNQKQ